MTSIDTLKARKTKVIYNFSANKGDTMITEQISWLGEQQ